MPTGNVLTTYSSACIVTSEVVDMVPPYMRQSQVSAILAGTGCERAPIYGVCSCPTQQCASSGTER